MISLLPEQSTGHEISNNHQINRDQMNSRDGTTRGGSASFYDIFNDTNSFTGDMSSTRSLSDVPEEGVLTAPPSPHPDNSPFIGAVVTSAASATVGGSSNSGSSSGSRRRTQTPSMRTMGRPSSDRDIASSSNPKKSSSSATPSSKDPRAQKVVSTSMSKIRSIPRLPHDKDAQPAPSTAMYWSPAPVYGTIPVRSMRAHTVNLVDTTAWVFGGCDDKDNSKDMKDIFCFDTETMQWSQRDTKGDIPPACRAHTTTLVDKKLIMFGGGHGAVYYNAVYVLDIATRTWSRPSITGTLPACRRAHTAVLYKHKIWVFGGGNGMTALNDVWTLDVSSMSCMKWEKKETTGKRPGPRGYHTANLVGHVMIVIGGSNAKDFFQDIWCLNMDTLAWSQVQLQGTKSPKHQRMTHSATQVGSYLFVFGGHNGTDYCNDLLLFNLVSLQYEQRQVLGKTPTGRGYHSTVLADSRLFLFGGYNGATAYDDVHILDLAAGAYLPQVTSFSVELEPS